MDQIIKDPKVAEEEPKLARKERIIPKFASPNFGKKVQAGARFINDDPILTERLIDACILKPNALSRGTQTSEKKPAGSVGEMFNAAETLATLYFQDLEKDKPGSETKSSKPTSESSDKNFRPTISEQIKDLFTTVKQSLEKAPDDFIIYVDCEQFSPAEVKAAIRSNFVVVHAKHDTKLDAHGLIKREFIRRWRIPDDVDKDELKCVWDSRGILIVKAPRKPTSIIVPIQIETHG